MRKNPNIVSIKCLPYDFYFTLHICVYLLYSTCYEFIDTKYLIVLLVASEIRPFSYHTISNIWTTVVSSNIIYCKNSICLNIRYSMIRKNSLFSLTDFENFITFVLRHAQTTLPPKKKKKTSVAQMG